MNYASSKEEFKAMKDELNNFRILQLFLSELPNGFKCNYAMTEELLNWMVLEFAAKDKTWRCPVKIAWVKNAYPINQ